MSKYETGDIALKDGQMYVCTNGLSQSQKKRLVARMKKRLQNSAIQLARLLFFNRKHREKLLRCMDYGDRLPHKYRLLYKDVVYFYRKRNANL
jgi:hypothetical protein